MNKESVDKLRKGHQAILLTISRIQQLARSFPQAQAAFSELDDELLAHWRQYNQAFFDQIIKNFEGDREVLKMLEFFQHDIRDVKIQYVTIREACEGSPNEVSVRNFPKDFKAFSEVLVRHIEMEEEYIFPIWEKMANK